MPAAALFPGVPYEYAAVVSDGSIIFTAGACPLDADGQVVGEGDVAAQANAAFDNLLAVLAQHGASAEALVRTTIYVVGGRSQLLEAWETLAGRLAPHRPPSSSWRSTASLPSGPSDRRVAPLRCQSRDGTALSRRRASSRRTSRCGSRMATTW